LGIDSWHEGEFKRGFLYLNRVHFAEPVQRPDGLTDFVTARRTAELGRRTVTDIQITQ
jgi:hypothetical protein